MASNGRFRLKIGNPPGEGGIFGRFSKKEKFKFLLTHTLTVNPLKGRTQIFLNVGVNLAASLK